MTLYQWGAVLWKVKESFEQESFLFLPPPGKFGPPHGDVPFASSKRSELVVEAPTSKTSIASSAEKKPRMEESEFEEEEETKHREIEFSQGLPVRGSERNRDVIQPRNTRVEDLKRPGSEVRTWKLFHNIFLCALLLL